MLKPLMVHFIVVIMARCVIVASYNSVVDKDCNFTW